MAKLDLDITVYSAAKYVKDFLQTPLSEAFKRIKFTEAKLELSTVPLAKGSNAVCLFVNDDGDAEVLEALAALGVKMIAMRCAGFDRIDLDACQRLGIQIARVPAYSPTAVAEFAVASMFAVLRHLCKAYVRVREGNYSLSGLVGSEVAHKTVGVVGTGIIGFHTCNNLVNMAKKVVAYDVVENPKVKELGIEYVSLDELFAQSDIISLHCPLMQATYHLIGEETVPKLKKGVLIVTRVGEGSSTLTLRWRASSAARLEEWLWMSTKKKVGITAPNTQPLPTLALMGMGAPCQAPSEMSARDDSNARNLGTARNAANVRNEGNCKEWLGELPLFWKTFTAFDAILVPFCTGPGGLEVVKPLLQMQQNLSRSDEICSSQLGVTVFSAALYVEKFIKGPLCENFSTVRMIEVRLNYSQNHGK
eukprot:jgi/Botrbrau1/19123/Bobra.0077s0035.1